MIELEIGWRLLGAIIMFTLVVAAVVRDRDDDDAGGAT